MSYYNYKKAIILISNDLKIYYEKAICGKKQKKWKIMKYFESIYEKKIKKKKIQIYFKKLI